MNTMRKLIPIKRQRITSLIDYNCMNVGVRRVNKVRVLVVRNLVAKAKVEPIEKQLIMADR